MLSGFRFPIGPDGPVYSWLARWLGEVGLRDGPGPGLDVPALTLTLSGALRTGAVGAVRPGRGRTVLAGGARRDGAPGGGRTGPSGVPGDRAGHRGRGHPSPRASRDTCRPRGPTAG